MRHVWLLTLVAAASVLACNYSTDMPSLQGRDVTVIFLHTTDIHSRLLPYNMKVSTTDQNLGIAEEAGPFGGAARIAYLVGRERALADRSLFLDTGDSFQGAPIFNAFQGEAEIRFLSLMGVDAMCLGNHDFDLGGPNLADKLIRFANFPILAANYKFAASQSPTTPPLADIVQAYQIFNLKGLRVGVIGLGNTGTMGSIFEAGNAMGITPIDAAEVTQYYIDSLRPQVDVIVVASHMGLTDDQDLIKNTTGIDIVFGGHHHVVLNPPKVIEDCQLDKMQSLWHDRFTANHTCKPRPVVLVHSGAFAKYVGRLEVSFAQDPADPRNWEVSSFRYTPLPVDSTVPDDYRVTEMLEPYRDVLRQTNQLDLILGYAPADVNRFGSKGGDSGLGNAVADAMRTRKGVETDFALTNSLGIRANLYTGPATIDDMYQIFPFENTIATMYLSGSEVVEMFDFVARRSASRGCQAQAQVSGAKVVLQCGKCDLTKRPWCLNVVRPEGCCATDGTVMTCSAGMLGYENCGSPDNCGWDGSRFACGTNAAPPPGVPKACDPPPDVPDPGCCRADGVLWRDGGKTSEFCGSYDQCGWDGTRFACGRSDPPPAGIAKQCEAAQEGCAQSIEILGKPVDLNGQYQLAANNYIAKGGSGFTMLKRNTTQIDTGIPQRDALMDYIRQGKPCGAQADGLAAKCTKNLDCVQTAGTGYVCGCASQAVWNPETKTCDESNPECADDSGRCVPAGCVTDVMQRFMQAECNSADTICPLDRCRCEQKARAIQTCAVTACIDASNGIMEDGRLTLLPP